MQEDERVNELALFTFYFVDSGKKNTRTLMSLTKGKFNRNFKENSSYVISVK